MELCDGGAVTDIFSVCQDPLLEEQIAMITKETLRVCLNLFEFDCYFLKFIIFIFIFFFFSKGFELFA